MNVGHLSFTFNLHFTVHNFPQAQNSAAVNWTATFLRMEAFFDMIRRWVEGRLPKIVFAGSLGNETAWMNVLESMNTWQKNLDVLQE